MASPKAKKPRAQVATGHVSADIPVHVHAHFIKTRGEGKVAGRVREACKKLYTIETGQPA